MDMHAGDFIMDGRADIEISLACIGGVNAALQTDLRCPAPPGFHRPVDNLLDGEQVGTVAKAFVLSPFGKCAEAAVIGAAVGIIDITIFNIAYNIAGTALPELIRPPADIDKLPVPGRKQPDYHILGKFMSALEHAGHMPERRDGYIDSRPV